MEFALWAEAVENAGSFYPPDVIKSYEAGGRIIDRRRGLFPRGNHQLVRPVIIVKGKAPTDMKNKEDYYDVVESYPARGLMQKPDASAAVSAIIPDRAGALAPWAGSTARGACFCACAANGPLVTKHDDCPS